MQELVNLILVDNVFSLVHIATCSLKNDLIFRQKEEAIDLMKCMVRWPPGIKIVIISKEREKKGKKERVNVKQAGYKHQVLITLDSSCR